MAGMKKCLAQERIRLDAGGVMVGVIETCERCHGVLQRHRPAWTPDGIFAYCAACKMALEAEGRGGSWRAWEIGEAEPEIRRAAPEAWQPEGKAVGDAASRVLDEYEPMSARIRLEAGGYRGQRERIEPQRHKDTEKITGGGEETMVMSEEGRRRISEKRKAYLASLTPEQRSANSRKGGLTKAAKQRALKIEAERKAEGGAAETRPPAQTRAKAGRGAVRAEFGAAHEVQNDGDLGGPSWRKVPRDEPSAAEVLDALAALKRLPAEVRARVIALAAGLG